MRKISLIVGALLVSFSCYANVSSVMTNVLKNTTNQVNSQNSNLKIIYGGQDISRHMIATAKETIWEGQEVLVG